MEFFVFQKSKETGVNMSIKGNVSKKIYNILDGKYIKDLSTNLKRMLFELFPESTGDDLITCKLKTTGKTNLVIECSGEKKNISILNKRFSRRERLYDFLIFLKK